MELWLRLLQFIIKILHSLHRLKSAVTSWRKKCRSVPIIRNKLLQLSVTELVQRLKMRQVTSTNLIKAYIERIYDINPYINAVVEERFEKALQEARNADVLISSCPISHIDRLFALYPILGIPFTVKDSCGVKGMSQLVGSIQRLKMRAKSDCIPVKNLRLAGGIPLLVSATPEYCFSMETFSLVNGRCCNPYNVERSSGGSSGGEGALNGSGASLFGVGSDIAGSIRIPGLFNGVFGHKPTAGLIGNQEHFPNSPDPRCSEYLQMGPITRFSTDLPLLLQIMVGSDATKLKLFNPVNVKRIKIFYSLGFDGLNGFLHQTVSRSIQKSITSAVEYFKGIGLETSKAKIKQFHNSTEIALTAIGRLRQFPYILTNDDTPPTVKNNILELLKSYFGNSNFTKEALIFELMRSTDVFMGSANMSKYEVELKSLKAEITDLLDVNGVLFFPTFHVSAIPHGTSLLPLWGIDYCLIFNALGLPSTHIPMGLDSQGLPVGFQVIAGPMQDKLCLHIAQELEKVFGGWVQPS